MATIQLPPDFTEFLQLLHKHGVEYLIVGGYAVGYYGYPRATGDMDVWIAFNPANLQGLVAALREFGFSVPEPAAEFLQQGEFVGIGNQPLRIEILTSISGVEFEECYAARTAAQIGELEVSFIGLQQLKINKQASGRFKDLNDISNLPD